MKLATILSAFVCCLIVVGQIRAETVYTRLTPEKTSDHLYSFTIKVEPLRRAHNVAQIDDVGEFLQFHVTVKLKDASKHGWLPRQSGEVRVFNGKEFIFSSDVQPTKRDGEFSFSFQVAAKYVEKSGFTFAETAGADRDGFFYWFYLKDFVPPANNEVKKELDKLEGTWIPTALFLHDGPRPLTDTKVEKIVINGQKWVMYEQGKQHEYSFTIDPSKNPKQMDSTGAFKVPVKSLAIYEVTQDALKFANGREERPSSFDKLPVGGVMFVYKRAKS